jgi:primosomal protein N' (replication factor Y)
MPDSRTIIYSLMNNAPVFIDVILPLPIPTLFTYRISKSQKKNLRPGIRVTVPFGKNKIYTAIVKRIHNDKPGGYEVRNIHTIMDKLPLVNEIQLKLWDWISEYYMCSPGEVFKAALPSGFKLESEKYKPKIQTYVRLNHDIAKEDKLNKILNQLERAPRQHALMIEYLSLCDPFNKKSTAEVEKSLLIKKSGPAYSSINSLVKKGFLEITEKEVGRLISDRRTLRKPAVLNDVQKEAMIRIKNNFKAKNVVLFHGVTSSGKTEIYIHLINEYIKKKKQILYLLPEIALTAQIINRLKNIFGDKAGVYHSRFSDNERIEIWKNILGETKQDEQQYSIILGARSSLFLPFCNLGLIIIDEEHDNSYKQFDPAPRYHGRDTAIMLARFHGAKVLMGTATPSVESYFNAKTGKYGLVELNLRYLELEMPEIIIANVREALRRKEMKSIFSPVLLSHISDALERKEQVILFQNRRGFSRFIECSNCGWIPRCKHCDVSLTYHKQINKISCHYCGYAINIPGSCEVCGSSALLIKGFGTEKVEDEISIFFPEAKIARLDLDSARSRKSLEHILSGFENGRIDILVGTQMVTKGLDFNNVRVVGILNADNMMNFPDFRSYERSYQLMAQVSGRAGRKNRRGIVIIQTSDPENTIIRNVENNEYKSMYNNQLRERKDFRYPPFYRLIKLTLKHKNKQELTKAATFLANILKEKFGSSILGPEPPLISKIQNLYLKSILFKLEKEKSVVKAKKYISESIYNMLSLKEFKSVQVIVDVDPV